ncbi:MAG: hypothetical protein H6566_30305 [Lewinellaceae bacterium]|nr:hypothetical protein [Lewinellaceae bacterium]
MEPRFASLLRQPTELSGKLETNAGALRSLQDFKPKNPKNDLTPRINGLADKREGLSGRTEELDNEATRLKSQYGEIRQEFSKLQNELSQRQDASEQMQIELEELVQRKAELTSQLEKKPKEIKNELEEIARNIEALCQDANSLTEKAETEAWQKEEALKKAIADCEEEMKKQQENFGAKEEARNRYETEAAELPNLRARYLKEILGAYTDKFEPIVLEGVVQETLDEEKRNAVIYLFFPEELLGRY